MSRLVKITENKSKGEEFWIQCMKCQVETVCRVISSVDSDGEMHDGNYSYYWSEQHQIIQCQGCKTLGFRHEMSNSEDYVQVNEEEWEALIKEDVYPPRHGQHPPLKDSEHLPYKVLKIYKEAHFNLCNKKPILAGIGIRALVEAVCRDRNATGSLYNMIEHLVGTGDLKRKEADILHKLRFMGNAAAHEVKPHDDETLKIAFDIVEHLLVTVYLLEIRASQL